MARSGKSVYFLKDQPLKFCKSQILNGAQEDQHGIKFCWLDKNLYTIDHRCPLEWLFFQLLHELFVSFTRLQKYVQDYEFHDCVMHQSPPPGTLLHSLFANLLSFARHKSRCVTEKSRHASNLVLLENLQQLCSQLWPSMPRDVCHVYLLLNNGA